MNIFLSIFCLFVCVCNVHSLIGGFVIVVSLCLFDFYSSFAT